MSSSSIVSCPCGQKAGEDFLEHILNGNQRILHINSPH
jgi:hypothetical protein